MRFPSECCQIHPDHPTDHAEPQRGAVQRTRALDLRNHNRQKRMPKRSHRRPELHGRILRHSAAAPRVALRRRRPLHAVAESDRRPRLLRPAHAMGLVAVDVQRPRARHRPDNALRPALRRRRERGLSGMRHPGRLGRHARQQKGRVDRPRLRAARSAVRRHSRRHEGNRDDGSRTEKPKAVEKDTQARLASVYAPAHRHRILPRRRDADARAQAPFRLPATPSSGAERRSAPSQNGFKGR